MHIFLLFLLYLCGIVIYWLKRADYAIRNKTTLLETRQQWLKYFATDLAYRTALEIGLFWWWTNNPALLFEQVNSTWGTNIVIPQNIATCLVAGLCVDSLVDWGADTLARKYPKFAFLTRQIPLIPEVKAALVDVPPKEQVKADEKEAADALAIKDLKDSQDKENAVKAAEDLPPKT